MPTSPIKPTPPANLANPLYYLDNAWQVINHCLVYYPDLLKPDEIAQLQQLQQLPTDAQALLIRLVMRNGELFRRDSLNYTQISAMDAAISRLDETGLINANPDLSLPDIGQLAKRQECLQWCRTLAPESHWPSSCRKRDLLAYLHQHPDGQQRQPLNRHWPDAPFQVVQLSSNALFTRLRLMFFGNLHQDWSAFVLTELGHQQFEPVHLNTASRPFQHRDEVDQYLQLHQLMERIPAQQPCWELAAKLLSPSTVEWLDYRRQKVLLALARQAQRHADSALAQQLYRLNPHPEAQIRWLRLQEKHTDPAKVFQQAQQAQQQIVQPHHQLSLQRILQRTSKKAGIAYQPAPFPALPDRPLILPKPAKGRVEQAVIAHLSTAEQSLFYVENRLFTGLFALLFWPALFAPVRGAFFHPFQAGPADLYRPTFYATRQALIDDIFNTLNDERYQAIIRQRLVEKRGINCTFIHWPSLTPSLVEAALTLIPASHLMAVFRYLLLDLRQHRSGLPDLILFDHAQQKYQLIEVKGPGDRLQDNQRLWLRYLINHGVTVCICSVQWQLSE